MNRRSYLGGLLAAALLPAGAMAQAPAGDPAASYPTRSVRIVVPFAPGSATDTITRITAQLLTEALGQSFVVENLGGAGGVTGSAQVARAAPDGYTLLAGSGAPLTVNPFLIPKMPYDPVRDFQPIIAAGDSPMVVAVKADAPYKSLGDLVAAAKAKPGGLTYGSGGNGSAAHIAAEVFKWKTGTDLVHVPYKGVAASVPDLAAGRLDALFSSYPSVQPLVASGALRVLAVAADKPSALVPGAPTAAQAGVKDYVLSTWNGLFAPAGTPRAIVDKLNAAVAKGLSAPAVRAKLAGAGMEPLLGSPEDLAQRVKAELAEMETLMKVSKIKAD